jgi:hypothetical protein
MRFGRFADVYIHLRVYRCVGREALHDGGRKSSNVAGWEIAVSRELGGIEGAGDAGAEMCNGLLSEMS